MSDPTNAALEAEAEATPPPEATPEPDNGPESLDEAKAMIKEARDEAAARRVTHKPYKDAFRGFNEDEQNYLLDIVRRAGGSAEEQKGAASDFKRLAEILSGEEATPDPEPKTITDEPKAEEEFTADSVRKMMDDMFNEDRQKREQETNLNSRVGEIKAEAAELGFEEGTAAYGYLMTIARTQTNGDLTEAAKVFNDMIAEKSAEAGGEETPSDTKWPTAPSTVGTPPPSTSEPDWLGDTSATTAAVKQWLSSRV